MPVHTDHRTRRGVVPDMTRFAQAFTAAALVLTATLIGPVAPAAGGGTPACPAGVAGQTGTPAVDNAVGYSDDDWNAHVEYVITALADVPSTEETFRGPDGLWSVQRVHQQNALIDEFWRTHDVDAVPREGLAIITGGVAGAGKSSILAGPAGIDRSRYFTVNPDDVKEAMAVRGMIPEVPGLSPMEASTKAHVEASMLAKRLADRAYRRRTNVIWDVTMRSEDSIRGRISAMKEAGYQQIDAVFVDIPVELARSRAIQRWRRGQEKCLAGEGLGGRYTPESYLDMSIPDKPGYASHNAEVFDAVQSEFTSTVVFENAGTEPVKRAVSGPRWQ